MTDKITAEAVQTTGQKKTFVKLKDKNIYGIIFKSRRLLVINLNFTGTYNVIYFHN